MASLSSSTQQVNAILIRDLLSKILNKRYPNVEDITKTELLEWTMWPSFFGLIGKLYM